MTANVGEARGKFYRAGREILAGETTWSMGMCTYRTDGHGNVLYLTVKSAEDQSPFGATVNEYRHSDAFGSRIERYDFETNPFQYCGEYYDEETGMTYLRARYYDPSIGRFISEDPVKDGLNWYVYCANDPVNAWDPSGMKPGDLFETPDLVALDFAEIYNKKSLVIDKEYPEGKEYGSLLYEVQTKKGKRYSYTEAVYPSAENAYKLTLTGKLPLGATQVGTLHTHAAFGGHSPSTQDGITFKAWQYNYLVIPSGQIKTYHKENKYFKEITEFVVDANPDSTTYLNMTSPEYKKNYEGNRERTRELWTEYNKIKNTLGWQIFLQKYNQIDPIDIVKTRIEQKSLSNTVKALQK